MHLRNTLIYYLTKIEKKNLTVISNPERIKNAITILKIHFKKANKNIKVDKYKIKQRGEVKNMRYSGSWGNFYSFDYFYFSFLFFSNILNI